MMLGDPLTDVKGVGEVLSQKFAVLGIATVADLINYTPRRYDDYSEVSTIARLHPGMVTIKAVIKQVNGRYVRRGMHVTEAVASDDTGSVRLIWFNQPYRAAAIKANTDYFIRGEFALKRQKLSIHNPAMELVSDFPINTARIVPVYGATKGLKSTAIQKAVHQLIPIIDTLTETLPQWIITQQQLVSRADAVRNIHFPSSPEALAAARQRLGFEEVFALTLAALMNREAAQHEESVVVPFEVDKAKAFVKHLPFNLTDAQRKAVWQIYTDMQRPRAMNRLLEGDVGSGKTVVATMAGLMALNANFQTVLMAPTEILARQLAETIHSLLKPLGHAEEVALLIGGMTTKQKQAAHAHIKQGSAMFIVGTHALIQDSVAMKRLGLVIIDEQHRFGVEQRKKLLAKAGHMPHVLSMTATPIPRSLALTLYGELDITILDTKPSNRKAIKTSIISPNSIAQMFTALEAQIEASHQVFVVCPVIEAKEGGAVDVETVYKQYSQRFKNRRVSLLHGRLKSKEKEAIMTAFVAGKTDILVSTTVIEVGVDVPNATVMVIHDAEQFGLAQMHQLRGRVGRDSSQAYCYLVLTQSAAPSRRLRALETSSDGFALAELDLQLRGPGAIYGTMQHGQLDLRIANLSDTKLIAAARTAAQHFIDRGENLVQYDMLAQTVTRLRAVTNLN